MHNGLAGRFIVMDRSLLAEVMAEAIEERFGGSLRAGWAATNQEVQRRARRRPKATGKDARRRYEPLDYATAWRLRNGKTGQLKPSTFDWLLLFVPKDDRSRLFDAVVSPVAQGFIDGHSSWVRRVTAALAGDPNGGRIEAALAALRRERIDRLLAQMQQLAPKAFERFDRVTGHHRKERIWLSRVRLAAPFLDARDTGGIERGWQELGEPELRKYIIATLKREEILLDRRNDVQRAQRLVVAGPNRDIRPARG